jgi:hypothetical protein
MRIKSLILLIISVLLSVSCRSAALQTSDQSFASQASEWKPASFQGIQIGTTTVQDAEKIFGKKRYQGIVTSKNESEVWNEYQVKLFDKWEGKLTMVTNITSDEGVISNAFFYPSKLSKSDAIEFFGRDFMISHYKTDECDDGESAAIIEDKSGDIETIEYRNKGIAIFMDDKDSVNYIEFVSKPIGQKKSKVECKPDGKTNTEKG